MSEKEGKSDRTGRNAPGPGTMPEEFINNDEVNQSEPPEPPEGSGEKLDEIDEAELRRGE